MISATSYGEVLQIRMSRYPDFPTGTWVCAYLVDGLLIDTGPAYTATELTEFLKDRCLKFAVNTHFHEDHISANKFLQDAYGIPIYAHSNAVEKIGMPAKLYPYQEDVWGYPVPSKVETVGDYFTTEKYRFDVFYTPGHDLDHICLLEATNGWLFTGDLYVTTRPVVCRPNDDMWQTIKDLQALRDLNPLTIFPAPTHVVKEPMEKLDKLVPYLKETGKRIEDLYLSGMKAGDIRKEVFGDEAFICEATQQQFSSLNMVKSFLRKYGGR
jgi:endoribonuclease LACTB2